MKIKAIAFTISMTLYQWGIACEACKRQQPKITQGLTHGTGPASDWDWVIVSVAFVILLLSFFLTIKYLVKPGEKKNSHIKYIILDQRHG